MADSLTYKVRKEEKEKSLFRDSLKKVLCKHDSVFGCTDRVIHQINTQRSKPKSGITQIEPAACPKTGSERPIGYNDEKMKLR